MHQLLVPLALVQILRIGQVVDAFEDLDVFFYVLLGVGQQNKVMSLGVLDSVLFELSLLISFIGNVLPLDDSEELPLTHSRQVSGLLVIFASHCRV